MAAQPMEYSDMSPFSAAHEDFLLEGDFYREPDTVTRGVTLPLDFSEADPFQDFRMDTLLFEKADSHAGKAELFQAERSEAFFSDLLQPPLLPTLPSWATSLAMREKESPAAVAQSLHDFLAQEPGEIVKVSAEKFAVKADVFQTVNGILLHCRLKARVYRSLGGLVVDFCRRSGDALAFEQTYDRAVQHLLKDFSATAAVRAGSEVRRGSAEEVPSAALEDAALDPLLELLRDASPAAQAQKAEALAALVTTALASTAGAITVCAALGRDAELLKACASSCRTEVSYPASQLEAVLHEHCGQIGVC